MLDCSETSLHNLTNEEMEHLSEDVLEEITDEVILGLCFEVHRAVKLNILFLDEPKEDEKKYEIVDEMGLDVFGQAPMKKQFECVCPNCQRNLAASRFAPHLEKCMGMGRNSSRLANKRIANSGKVESDVDDYDNDSDWNYSSERKSTKRKRDKNSPRRTTKIRGKNGESAASTSSDGSNVLPSYEVMTFEERKAVLMQMCGVVSEHTKKMCTRSHRCPQHTDEQRRYVRHSLLGRSGLADASDEVQVDVDTVEDDGQTQRIWDSGNSGNPSPADSSSTSNGASSASLKKKEKKVPSAAVPKNSHSNFPKKSKSKPIQNSGTSSSQMISGPSNLDDLI